MEYLFGIKSSCFSSSIHPSCNSFRENKTQEHEREEKEDNDKDMKNACLIMVQILSLFHISSLSFPSKRNNWHMLYFESRLTQKMRIGHESWHQSLSTTACDWVRAITLKFRSESLSKRMLFLQHPFQQEYALSSREVAEHFKCYRIFSDSCFQPVHSKTQSQKEDKEIVLLFQFLYYLFTHILLPFTPWQHLKCYLSHYNHTASWKPIPA